MRVLHLSDVHLGADLASFGALADARRQEILDAFLALPDLAEAEGVDAVFIAGDLFETPRPSEYTLSLVRRTIRRLTDSGRPVCLVAGHHDPAYANPALWRDALRPAIVLAAPCLWRSCRGAHERRAAARLRLFVPTGASCPSHSGRTVRQGRRISR